MYFILLIITSFSVCVLTYCVYRFKRYLDFRKAVNKFPGRTCNFFIGDVITNLCQEPEKLFRQVRDYVKEFPMGFRWWGAARGIIILLKPNDIKTILSDIKYIKKDSLYILLYPWLQRGLLTSDGEKWKQRRKILTTAFHFNILRRFILTFNEHCEKLVAELKDECSNEKTNVSALITKCTLGLICETSMGIKLNENDTGYLKYKEALYAYAELLVERSVKPWLFNEFIFYLSPQWRKQKKQLKVLHDFTRTIIKKREEIFNPEDLDILQDDENEEYVYKKRNFAMLDLLIYSKRNGEIDDNGIQEEVDTFLFEGHDTVTMALCYTLLMLANHKDLQEKVRNEVDNIFQKTDRYATYKDLQNMQYLEMFLKETLRLYPSVPLISRTVDYDVPMQNGKRIIPKGCHVHTFIYDLHRDPEIYPNPEKFDPDRFLPEHVQNRHPYAYIPFSAGPRNCIGQRFAMLEMKTIISWILRHYEIDPVDKPSDVKFICDLVLRPKNPIHVKFKPRSYH